MPEEVPVRGEGNRMTERKRILLVTNLYPPHARGGAEWVAADIAEYLSAAGFDLQILTSRGTASSARKTSSPPKVFRLLIERAGRRPEDFAGRLRHLILDEYYDPVNAAFFRATLERFRPHLIYLNAPTGLSHAPFLLSLRTRLPLLIHLHDYWLRDFLAHRKLGFLNRSLFNRQVARKESRISLVAVSERVAELYGPFLPPGISLEVVPNGVRPPSMVPPKDDERKDCLYCGRISRAKGLHVLASSSIRCDVLGDPNNEYARECQRIAGNRLHFLGRVDRCRVPEIMSRYRILLLPSLWEEPCPLTLLEAMSVGCIPVASRIGGIPELVAPTGQQPCGILVEPGDAKGLEKAAKSVLEDKARRLRLSNQAIFLARNHFPLNKTLQRIETICRRLMDFRSK
ncbi:MAG: glycosyltransferase [Candidatus Hydrogenedentota bacterium]|nr:MAG: glycosyltransferase [Candidatus Hydrogenedentota bacterium]